MHARSEPLLWLQLIAVGVLPLEALLLLLLLAGSDPGPLPALERLLCWGMGGLLPALVLWRRPADVWSLLLLQTPLRARRPLQQRLSALQETAASRVGLLGGSGLLLALLWWSDEHAAIAGQLSPLAASPRLVGLLLAALLLALMLWQWQQLLQSLGLLSRSPGAIAAATPMTTRELEEGRLCLGLPLLLIAPLPAVVAVPRWEPRSAQPTRAAVVGPESTGSRAEPVQVSNPGPADQLTTASDGAIPPSTEPVEAPSAAAETGAASTRGQTGSPLASTPVDTAEPTPSQPTSPERTSPEPPAWALTSGEPATSNPSNP